ncbi:glycosyl hydrolase [Anaerocolumna sp. AGMB13025]|uniref:glycosyl hydrolase n=1 Tax=Anaerocolumna sp. AGMB13025 TaxID=3039116 RepID=UPI00241EC33F|nr:glycosyl hydrolase [Anaerocolumna sp. AGMB13025]WFR56358.1 glycosyl hydrolase [Anaerocolumna sp. AGMB13025]
MLKEFKNPSNQYRPIPFWSWNDKLNKEELKYQIEEMKEAGVGGYFMHARSGLKVDYLSEEWFDCIKTGLDKGKEVGLDAWIYDEEGWPSGFAGGIVPALSPDYHAKFMTLETQLTTDMMNQESVIAGYVYNKAMCTYRRITHLDTYSCQEGEELLVIRKHTNPYYIDTMNKRAVEAFLKSTHDVYYEKFGEDFGTYMKGFFTDEPRLACNNFGELAWSDELVGEFVKKYGYDIRDHIPALYRKTDNYETHRYNFWELVSELFVQSYMKTIYDWCEAHKVKATGHIMMEESIFSQMTSTAGVMPFYEYLHIPGIDWLRRPISSPVIGKQVGSVACQLGKKQVLTESFALCGWNVSFEELKWIAEWQFVNGVNQICQHLQAYTIKGVRKRDYPPSLFIQQTWWKEYRQFNDYLGRLCVVLSEGSQTADVLLLHPMGSGFIAYDGTRTEEIISLDDAFTKLSETLSGNHISYHFGDETIIKRHGKVEGSRFVVGEISYRTVILPHMYAMNANTLALLLTFTKNGGTVFCLGEFPTYTNGSKEDLSLLENKVLKETPENIRELMMQEHLVALSIADQNGEVQSISYQQRETEDGILLFMVNHHQKDTYHADITIFNKQYKVIRMIAETGDEEVLSYDTPDGSTNFNLTFEPMQSYIINLIKLEERSTYEKEVTEVQSVSLCDHWKIDRMDLNSMTLDYCSYRIDGGKLQGPIPVIKLQSILMDLQRPCDIELYFNFRIAMDLEKNKEFYAVIEDADIYGISVNGKQIPYKDLSYWKDKSFKNVDIKSALVPGENEIILKTNFFQPQKVYDVLYGDNVYETEKNKITYEVELESIYLLGDFGVVSDTPYYPVERGAMVTSGPFTITERPETFNSNEFTVNGLTFFAGQLEISQELSLIREPGKRVVLQLKKHHAPLVKLYVNDMLVKHSLWAPYTADITDYVKDGVNLIRLQVFASNRNLLGPHHHIDGECYNVGPESFTGKWSWVERKSEADATEIFDRNKNYWTDSYCFVEFGLS